METIPTQKLLEELRAIDPRIQLVPNPNRPGLSNLKINGVDICPVPSEVMQTEHTHDYIYRFPNDMVGNLKTYDEAKSVALSILNRLKEPSFADEFFSKD